MLKNYFILMRLHKPIGIWLLLWPTLMALWIAGEGHPDRVLVVLFTLGVIIMRSAGCVINDWADRRYDGHVARTQTRPLVTGQVSTTGALILFFLLLGGAFLLVCAMNRFTQWMSLGGVALAVSYPFMKRYTHFPQVVLGAAYSWAIPMAYAAQTQSLPIECWILYAANVVWVIAYDTLYAMTDRADDLKIGVKSTAIFFGRYDKMAVALLHSLAMGLWIGAGLYAKLGIYFYIGIIVAVIFAVYQQWLIRHREPMACFKAFLNNQWIGAALFVSILFST